MIWWYDISTAKTKEKRKMSQKCGSCKFFVKLKNVRFDGGLCSFKKANTKTESDNWCSSLKLVNFNNPSGVDVTDATK